MFENAFELYIYIYISRQYSAKYKNLSTDSSKNVEKCNMIIFR